eukprot:TRINITY_DN692_c0_g1_i1.p1 TRINITY_DN692_c0_g1~~TRINITY_DN692_c0_g1_i1.p1  ORF type:complete len:738 (-),score=94.72 TRINITY_DN692_c0_g1_i1:103-2190(-)
MASIIPGGDTLRHAILKRKEVLGRCSWCFSPDPVPHHSEERYVFLRDLFHCTICQRKTVKCKEKTCQNFARGYEGLLMCDSFCYQHQKIIDSWQGAKTRDSLNVTKHCSWCFQKTAHALIHSEKKLYECMSCFRIGASCKGCDSALSRNGALGGDKCLLCAGVISKWSVEAKADCDVTGWCSICFEYGNHSLLEKKIGNQFGLIRDEYMCNTCSCITARCSEVTCHNMVRGCITHRKCQKCSDSKWDWECISARKAIFVLPCDVDTIRANLIRESPEKQIALTKGMIRPFLYLVSMHPAARNALATTLGLYLLKKSFYGDPHLEADYIINHSTRGILFRGSQRMESMRKKNTSWYKIIRRNEAAIFKGRNLGVKLDNKMAQHQSSQKGLSIELEFMEKIANQQRSKISTEKAQLIDRLIESPPFLTIQDKMDIQGVSPPGLFRWLIEMMIDMLIQQNEHCSLSELEEAEGIAEMMKNLIHQQVIQGWGYFYTKKRHAEIASKTANVCATIAVQQLVIIPLMPAVGIAYIVFRISDALTEKVFGSEPEVLYPTIQQLLTQRLFLSYLGINIDSFYEQPELKTPAVTPVVTPITSRMAPALPKKTEVPASYAPTSPAMDIRWEHGSSVPPHLSVSPPSPILGSPCSPNISPRLIFSSTSTTPQSPARSSRSPSFSSPSPSSSPKFNFSPKNLLRKLK